MYPGGQQGNGGNPAYNNQSQSFWPDYSPADSPASHPIGSGPGSLTASNQANMSGIYHPGAAPSLMHHPTHQTHFNLPIRQASHHYYPYPISSPVLQRSSSGHQNPISGSGHNLSSYSAPSPYGYSAMQSPPPTIIGSPGQPYSNSSSQSTHSPTRSISSPLSFPIGSPLMRQYSGALPGPSPVQGPPTTPSPHPLPPSPSPSQSSTHSQSAVSSVPPPSQPFSSIPSPAAPAPIKKPPPTEKVLPSPPVDRKPVITNGKALPAGPSAPPAAPQVLHSESVVEEPLPQYPSPEELEKMAQHTRPMVPEAMLNRIFARAGLSFSDPKIGTLISLASQNLINDLVKEAMALSPGQARGQLTRRNLEAVLQERGMKQLPSDPFTTPRPTSS